MSRFVDQISERGEWALLEAHWPGCAPAPIGILLRERSRDRLHVKVCPKWCSQLPDLEEADLWRELAEDLEQQAQEEGAGRVLDWLESTTSHVIRISTRQEIPLTTAAATLDHLYQQHLGVSRRWSEEFHRIRLFWYRVGICLFSCEPNHRWWMNGWRAQAALAVTLLLTATWAGLQSPRPRSSPLVLATKIQEASELPLLTGVHYQPVLWNLDLDAPTPPLVHRPRMKRPVMAPRPRRHFRMDHMVVRPRLVQLARLDPPLLNIEPEIRPVAWVPNALESSPAPPPYRARRNKFVRALALVAAPFRVLTK